LISGLAPDHQLPAAGEILTDATVNDDLVRLITIANAASGSGACECRDQNAVVCCSISASVSRTCLRGRSRFVAATKPSIHELSTSEECRNVLHNGPCQRCAVAGPAQLSRIEMAATIHPVLFVALP